MSKKSSHGLAGLVLLLAIVQIDQARANPGMAFHVAPATGRYGTRCAATLPSCGAFVTAGSLMPQEYHVYVIAVESSGAGLSALEFGIDYAGEAQAGLDVFQWFGCAPQEIPSRDWPSPGSGNTVLWQRGASCTPGYQSVVGYFHCGAYSADVLRFTAHPGSGSLQVEDCAGTVTTIATDGPLSAVGTAAFSANGTQEGSDPCLGLGLGMQGARRADTTPAERPGVELKLDLLVPANPVLLRHGSASFQVSLPQDAQVELSIFDVAGRRVWQASEGSLSRGVHAILWDGRTDSKKRVAAGLYFVRLLAGRETITRRILVAD